MPIKTFLILGLLALASHDARAGHENGHGCGGFLCEEGGRPTVNLLDLWEAQVLRKHQIRRNQNAVESQLEEAIDNVRRAGNGELSMSIEGEAKRILGQLRGRPDVFLPPGVGIAFPEDAKSKYVKKGCTPVGIALYDDENEVLDVDRTYYDLLSRTDTAGVVFHEAVYKVLREWFRVSDSRLARAITGCSFLNEPCPELNPHQGIPSTGGYECETRSWTAGEQGPSRIVAYPGGSCPAHLHGSSWRIHVTGLSWHTAPTLGYIDVCESLSLAEYFEGRAYADGNQHTEILKASADRWQNIAPPLPIHFSSRKEGIFINNRRFYCHKR